MMIMFMFLNPDEHVSIFMLICTNFLLLLSRKRKLPGYISRYSDYVMGWMMKESGFDSLQGEGTFLF
jgi:hypothetical protein